MTAGQPNRKATIQQLQGKATQALEAGDAHSAVPLFREVAARMPGDAAAQYNLALALARTGEAGEAAHAFSRAARAPRLREGALRNLSRQIRLIPAFTPGTMDAIGLAEGLRADGIDRQPFVRASLDLAARSEPWASLMQQGRSRGWETAARALLQPAGRRARTAPFVLEALSNGVNVSDDLEYLLTATRRRLREASGPSLDGGDRSFAIALARQAHNNEYVWPISPEERRWVDASTKEAKAAPADVLARLGPALAALLCYRPAWEVFDASDDPRLSEIRPRALQALIREQLARYEDERALATAIPALGSISDAVSQAVAAQYEANPYPRWLTTDLPAPDSAGPHLAPYFDKTELGCLERPARLLIAGCGTGRQVVEIARLFGTRTAITAIDLSRASLGYAARKCREYGIDAVEFRHADILSLDGTETRFDVVISDGVLHHMDDPIAGWAALERRLLPGGLMRISLYSALARQLLDRDRERAIGNEDIDPADPDALRDLRRRMFDANRADPASPPYSAYDWYTLSTFRDLIVHVREHRYTVPEISEALKALDLEFRGFILPRVVTDAFRRRFPAPDQRRDLDCWWRFEQDEPATFANMYSFWCRKPDAA